MNLTLNLEPEKSLSTSRWTSSVGIKNASSKTLVERTETDEEKEVKQNKPKGFRGHYSAVALTGTDEYMKVNRTPEPERQTQAKKLRCGRDRSS